MAGRCAGHRIPWRGTGGNASVAGRRVEPTDLETRFQSLVQSPLRAAILRFLVARPGEAFDVSVLARDADGRPVPAQPIQAVLKNPTGRSQFTAMWKADPRFPGYYVKRLELPADAATGRFAALQAVMPPTTLATSGCPARFSSDAAIEAR